jgi:hypothetical protein
MIPFTAESNSGGVKFIQIGRHDLVDWNNYPAVFNGNIPSAVPFLAGGYWERINFPPKFTEYTETLQDNGGVLGLCPFIVNKSRPYIIDWVLNRKNFRYIMLVTTGTAMSI